MNCDQIRENLAALAEDDLDDATRDHLAECDACRDLRHEIRQAVEHVGAAGVDYVPPVDLEARLYAALDARGGGGSASGAAPGAGHTPPMGTMLVSGTQPVAAPTSQPSQPALTPTRETPAFAPTQPLAAVTPPPQPAAPQQQPPVPAHAPARNVLPFRNRRLAWVAGALLATTAAAAGIIAVVSRDGSKPTPPVTNPNAAMAGLPWTARVGVIARAARERAGGVEVKLPGANAFVALAEGAQIPAGAEVRTDARTRARLELSDGSHVVLDRATSMRFESAQPRAATLVSGALVADVAHVEGAPPARVALPNGGVQVLGTKFALTAASDRSTVRVTRGVVRMLDARGRQADVKTGQEGVITASAVPEVAPAVNLAEAVAWSELAHETRVEPDAPIVGLGELRARRPGQTTERDHAVSLAAHSVRVRIVGNMARTEIEEVFRNDTANELEGIYRFPLPPDAQIERLALDVNGRMEEGAFVDKQRAAAIWRGVIRNAQRPMLQAQQTEDLVWVPGPWRDPALLEWQRGGRFELRIFPIPARGSRRVSIAYTQAIPASGGVRRYVYPLAHDANGSTRVDQFDVDVQVMGNDRAAGVRTRGYTLTPDAANAPEGATRLGFEQSGFVPAGDLVVEYALPNRGEAVTAWSYQPPVTPAAGAAPAANANANANANARAANSAATTTTTATPGAPVAAGPEPAFVAMALRPTLPRWVEARARDYAFIVDTSRSMVGERLARAARLATAMVREMDARDRVTVLACDTQCRAMPGGLMFPGAQTVRAIEGFLASEEPMGASDLTAQVRAAVAAVGHDADRDARVVYLGDGAATVGYRRPDRIAAEISAVMPRGRASLTAIALGSDADASVLSAMARAGGGVMVPYAPGESLATAALASLEATYGVTLRDPVLTLPAGLTEVAPAALPTIRAGSETIVVARMTAPEVTGEVVLRGTVSGEPYEARYPITVRASTSAGNAFVPRVYAATRIADLEAAGAPASREEIVRLSQRFRVASRYTSLLVLESDAMYRAFGVERNAAGEAVWTGEQASDATVALAPNDANQIAAALDPSRAHFASNEGGLEEPGAGDAERAALGAVGGLVAGAGSVGGAGAGFGAGHGRFATRAGAFAQGDDADELAPSEPDTARTITTEAPRADAPAGGEARGRRAAAATSSTRAPEPTQPAPAQGPVAANGAAVAAPRREAEQNQQPLARDRAGFLPVLPRPTPRATRGGGGGGQWMRRIWVRRAAVGVDTTRDADRGRIATAERALQQTPDSRARHMELYRWLSLAGQFDQAQQIAQRWSSRDALDPDALVRLSDIAARRGQRDRAVRILAGTVDVRPDDADALKRMALLHERAGEAANACAYRVALAESRAADIEALTDAVRCERAQGRTAAATRLLDGVADAALRARVEAALNGTAQPGAAASPNAPVRGDVTVDASWDTPVDLDVAVVDARGNRVSWMGGRARGLTTRGARDLRGEALGLSRAAVGEYVIEVSRTAPDARFVRGQVTVSVLGERRTVNFALGPSETTQRVARATITREERLVPATNAWE